MLAEGLWVFRGERGGVWGVVTPLLAAGRSVTLCERIGVG